MDPVSTTSVRPATRVCLLEDDADIAEATSAALRNAGYDVEAYPNGLHALKRLREHPADLILLDLRMPYMDGWQFRVAQRADSSLENIPVVVLTADTSPQAAAIHAASSLRKPFATSELLSTVQRVLIESERRKLAASLEETGRLALLGTLAPGVGHEANNPLASAMANLEMMEESMPQLLAAAHRLEPSGSEAPGVLESGSLARQLLLMREQLHESRAGLERVRLVVRNLQNMCLSADDDRTQVDVNALLDAAIDMAWNQIKYRARLTRAYSVLPEISGNKARLSQLFMHLLVNAARTMTPGSAAENVIRVTTHQEHDVVIIAIQDTGTTLSESSMARVFDPFSAADGPGEGTALGVPICRDIVEAHHGRLDVYAVPSGGNCFTIRLPCSVAVQVRSPVVESFESERVLRESLIAARALHAPRLWIVDDEPTVSRVAGTLIGSGYEVSTFENPNDVLFHLHAGERFDVLLSDVMMPNMTGVDLARRIGNEWSELSARIIFMSGGALSPLLNSFVKAPDRLFLEKPFTGAELRAIVARVAEPAIMHRI